MGISQEQNKFARAVIDQLDAHCDLITAALTLKDYGEIAATVKNLNLMTRRLEEYFIRTGHKV